MLRKVGGEFRTLVTFVFVDLHERRSANSLGRKEWNIALAERLGLPSYIHCVKPAKDPFPVGMKVGSRV